MITDIAAECATAARSRAIDPGPRSGPPTSVTDGGLRVVPRRGPGGRRGIRIHRRAVPPRLRLKGILPFLRRHRIRAARRAREMYLRAVANCVAAGSAQGCAAGGPGE